jgi:hypothetical protein
LWVGDYPDTEAGNEALDAVLKKREHAEKLARLAATPCDMADTFPRRVVMHAKGIVADLEGTTTAPAPAPAAATATVPAERRKYGRYLPWQRVNVDQVPLPFVNDMDITYKMKGATRVAINQLGPSMSKRQATGQTCIRAAVPPPPEGADERWRSRSTRTT